VLNVVIGVGLLQQAAVGVQLEMEMYWTKVVANDLTHIWR
jgi:hypothetical protein